MKPRILSLVIPTLCAALFGSIALHAETGDYTLVVEGFDWGPSASKVIVSVEDPVTEANPTDFSVEATRSTELMPLPPEQATGTRSVIHAYPSDPDGNMLDSGSHITLVMFVGPTDGLGSPMQYVPSARNQWIDYRLTVKQHSTGSVWTNETRRIRPLVDAFESDGTYTHEDDTTLTYASFTPTATSGKRPLIIWLHGGGEGGTDPSIVLMANRAANYASDEIQTIFGGAYVLAPQTPTRWMHGISGEATWGQEDDIYHKPLMGLFRHFISRNPDVDPSRIYVGGCSNGGYMSLKLLIENPRFFAGAFISSMAYKADFISDESLQKIKDTPVWFVHASADDTTPAADTVIPLHKRLLEAGATNVHLSLYDHVTDITGVFGGDGYRYNGHFSWVYLHANHCRLDADGKPVMLDGRPTTIMEWLATQRLP